MTAIFRTPAQAAVIARIDERLDYWSQRELDLTDEGLYADATEAHQLVLYLVRARDAEARPDNRRVMPATFYERPAWDHGFRGERA